MTETMDIRGPVGDWNSLRTNPDYKADWQANGGSRSFVDSAEFALRAQTEADLNAARWGLLAWEDLRERSRFKPFWIDEQMLMAVVVEPGRCGVRRRGASGVFDTVGLSGRTIGADMSARVPLTG